MFIPAGGALNKRYSIKLWKILEKITCRHPENLIVYIGPSISQANYEVGTEVAEKFDSNFVFWKDEKVFLDVSGINYKLLLDFGIPKNQIQKSELCTYEFKDLLHSYRRDGSVSGRSIGVIAIKG